MGNASAVKSGGGLAEVPIGPAPSYLSGISKAAMPSTTIRVDRVEGIAQKRNAMEAFGGMRDTKPENYGVVTLQ